MERISRIFDHLKKYLGFSNIDKLLIWNNNILPFVERGKNLNQQYILPLYISVKAVMSVSWEILL
jgi:hypothetical protein